MDAAANSKLSHPRRIWSFDLLRIVAALGVVSLHMTPSVETCGGVGTLSFQVSMFTNALFRWCVPVFFMLSGALFLSPSRPFSTEKLFRKTIMHIVTSFVFWSAFYAIVYCIITGKGKWTFLNQFFVGHYHMWYLFSILGMYLLTPLLRLITASRQKTEYLLVLGMICFFLLPQGIEFILLLPVPHADVFASMQVAITRLNPLPRGYVLFFYVLGYYLSAFAPSRCMRRSLYAAGIAGYILTSCLTIWHSSKIGNVSTLFSEPTSFTVLLTAAAVFVFFQHRFSTLDLHARSARVVVELSACSFGVYLLHPFFIERLQLPIAIQPLLLMPSTIAAAFFVFLLSLSVSFLLRRTKIIGKYIL